MWCCVDWLVFVTFQRNVMSSSSLGSGVEEERQMHERHADT